jgi:hypothetical protein
MITLAILNLLILILKTFFTKEREKFFERNEKKLNLFSKFIFIKIKVGAEERLS